MSSYLTPSQLAQQWAVSRRTVVRLIERGLLHAVRIGEQWRIPAGAVEIFEAANAAPTNLSDEPAPMQAPRSEPFVAAPAIELGGEYVPIFRGPVPWRDSIVESRPTASRRSRTQRERLGG